VKAHEGELGVAALFFETLFVEGFFKPFFGEFFVAGFRVF
jgi:hypothetical protein